MKKNNTTRCKPRLDLFKNKLLLTFLVLLLTGIISKADVITYEWAENYKGYTIKQIPGTDEYVAAGTYHQNQNNVPILFQLGRGYHVLHLDASGGVLSDIKYTPNNAVNSNYIELRVIDVVPLNNMTDCWVIMQATEYDYNTTITQHHIYAEKVDLATGQKSTNLPYEFKLTAGPASDFPNLFATSAVQYNDDIYISGYKSGDRIAGVNPQGPTYTSMNKVGCLFKVITTGTTQTFLRYDYETSDGGLYDYDMALRIKVIPPTLSTPQTTLILVGAANNNYGVVSSGTIGNVHGGGVFLARFDPNPPSPLTNIGLMPGSETVVYDVVTTPQSTVDYSIFPSDVVVIDDDVFVSCNRIENNQLERWGVLRVQSAYGMPNDLKPNITVPCYVTHNTQYFGDDWSRQLFHKGNFHNGDEYLLAGYAIDFPNRDASCNIFAGSNPSTTNVNPFMASIQLNYTGATGITGTMQSYTIHNNDRGTESADPNQSIGFYYPAGGAGWNMNEDIVRLHSPFCEDEFNMNYDYRIMAPMMGYHPGAPVLNVKYIETDIWGSERDCNKQLGVCYTTLVSSSLNYYDNSQSTAIVQKNFSYTTTGTYAMTQVVDAPITNDCNTNTSYKPTGVASVNEQSEISIYPNPATIELNIKLGAATNAVFEFILTDITGKVIYTSKGVNDGTTQHIELPNLSTGIYIASMETSGKKHTEKIIIE